MSGMPEIPKLRGRHWLQYVTTGVALLLSLISLWVAIETEVANRQMVAASSWPYLEVDSSNVDSTGRSVLLFSVTNGGVGPAKVHSFEVFYKGKPYSGSIALMNACCEKGFHRPTPTDITAEADNDFTTGGIAGHVIRAGETHNFIIYGLNARTAVPWRALDRARNSDITYRVCYCSVFNECWFNAVTGRNELHPVRTPKCPVPPVPYTE